MMKQGAMGLRWLHKAVVGLFVAALCAGIFLPVYSDEVGWRFQERAGFDGVDKLFNDACGPNTLAVPPVFMMPVRYYSAFFNGHFADPFYIRLSGVAYALIWVMLVLALIRRMTSDRADRATLSLIGFGLMSLGTLPLLMVWSRPEQPIVLATAAALLVALGRRANTPEAASVRGTWLRAIAIVVLGAIIYSYHLKGLMVTPVLLMCLVFAGRGRETAPVRLVMGAVLLALAGWSAHYWIHRLQCPGDPLLAVQYAYNNKGFDLLGSRNFGEAIAAVRKIAANANLFIYFSLPVPRPDPMSQWLQDGQVSETVNWFWLRGLVFVWSAALLLGIIAGIDSARSGWRERRIDARLGLAATLLVACLGWSATQAFRNPYEGPFVLSMLMLAVLLALAACEPAAESRIEFWKTALARIIGVLAIASIVTVTAIYGPSIARANRGAGYIAEQPHSLRVFGYAALKPDILGAARQCGIGDPAKQHALMIDDMTYFAFIDSRLPQHQLGVVGQWNGGIKDPMAYLRSRGSSGAVVGCHLLPDDLRRRAKRQGLFCCLAPDQL